ncbi:MAG: VWA domain-containing protein [Halioglobus sp.]
MAKRRIDAINLSFLDIMACGFGAVTLLFLILRHTGDLSASVPNTSIEASLIAEDLRNAQMEARLKKQQKTEIEEKLDDLRRKLSALQVDRNAQEDAISEQIDPDEALAALRKQVLELEAATADAELNSGGENVRRFVGDADRQYLTGLHLGGERVLILIDASASMLADDIVNVLRRRNMTPEEQRASAKWKWAVRTVQWLIAQLPPHSRFQVYAFNTEAHAVLPDTEGQWLDAADSLDLEKAIDSLESLTPENGTSLVNAFASLSAFDSPPDNLFLLTDGLPTQGKKRPSGKRVSAAKRMDYFNDAVSELPDGVSTNIILFPMEGDYRAAAAFWHLATTTQGAFLTPSRDWP